MVISNMSDNMRFHSHLLLVFWLHIRESQINPVIALDISDKSPRLDQSIQIVVQNLHIVLIQCDQVNIFFDQNRVYGFCQDKRTACDYDLLVSALFVPHNKILLALLHIAKNIGESESAIIWVYVLW
jgi:hypothetical protein